MMLKSFTAESTDERWTPSFVERPSVLHKLVNLEGLSLYLQSGACDVRQLLSSTHEDELSHVRCILLTEGTLSLSPGDARKLEVKNLRAHVE